MATTEILALYNLSLVKLRYPPQGTFLTPPLCLETLRVPPFLLASSCASQPFKTQLPLSLWPVPWGPP